MSDEKSAVPTATFDELVAKPRRRHTFPITLPDGNGGTVQRSLTYQAINGLEYDKLIAKHPPTPAQKADGLNFNPDTFAPALISAVSYEPELTYAQAEQLYHSPEWSGGEMSTLYITAQRVCNAGLDIPFSEHG